MCSVMWSVRSDKISRNTSLVTYPEGVFENLNFPVTPSAGMFSWRSLSAWDHLFPDHTILMAGTEPSAPTSTLTVVCSLENPPRLYAGPEKPFTAKTFWSLVPHVMGVSSWLYSCLGSLKHSENFGSFTNLPSTSLNQLSKSTNYFVQKNSLLDREIASG